MAVRPLTPDLWPALADLLGDAGAASRCWCMYWQIGPSYRQRSAEVNRSAFHQLVNEGPPPGLIAFVADLAVGWCQVTPRPAIPAIDTMWRLKRIDDVPVWSISCLYVRKGYRRRGVTSDLVAEAVEVASRAGSCD